MKDTPDQFIGVYSGTSPTAPTAYTSYQWYKYKGEKGETGETGPAGPGVSVTVGTTTTGLPGTNASVVNVGTASDPILNFTIPRGDKGQNEVTENTVTNISGVLVGANGNVRAGVAGTDFAAASHAAQHASGGADAITPAAIGAAASTHAHGNITNAGKVGSTADLPMFTLTGGAVGTKSKDDAKIALDIDPRGFEYGGREIPFTWAQIKAKVAAGDFTGLRVGDYKDISVNGTYYDAAASANKTFSNNVVRMEIAGIDSYYRYADTSVPHHIDFISRDCLPDILLYNATNTNSGSFIGSALFTTLNGANGIVSLLPSDVAAVVIQKRGITETKTGADATGWAWNDMGKLWLPTEREVWGNPIWSELKYGVGLNIQYPIFKDGLSHIIKGAGNGGGRCNWWCASSVAGSAINFCFVNGCGLPTISSAAGATVRVPLCFRVA